MKTRLTLFSENLTQDEFNLAFDYTIQSNKEIGMKAFDKKYINFEDALSMAFRFDKTIEGFIYWHKIIDRQRNVNEPIEKVKDSLESDFYFDKMIAYNEIIGLAQGYLDVIIEHPDRAQELAENALEVINLKYERTKRYVKRNN